MGMDEDEKRAKRKAKDARYLAKHKDKHAAAMRAWEAAHRDERRAYFRAWAEANRGKRRDREAKRRNADTCEHSSCAVLGPVDLAWTTSPHECWMCGTPVWPGVNLHMDHVIPLAKGGLHCAHNIRPACAPCNLRKAARVAA